MRLTVTERTIAVKWQAVSHAVEHGFGALLYFHHTLVNLWRKRHTKGRNSHGYAHMGMHNAHIAMPIIYVGRSLLSAKRLRKPQSTIVTLRIEVLDVQRVILNERATMLDHITHQR